MEALWNRSERCECKECGAQEPRHINWIGEIPGTARRSNRAVQ